MRSFRGDGIAQRGKTRAFAGGGEVDSVYERAKRFLEEGGIKEETPALDEKIMAAQIERAARSAMDAPRSAPAPRSAAPAASPAPAPRAAALPARMAPSGPDVAPEPPPPTRTAGVSEDTASPASGGGADEDRTTIESRVNPVIQESKARAVQAPTNEGPSTAPADMRAVLEEARGSAPALPAVVGSTRGLMGGTSSRGSAAANAALADKIIQGAASQQGSVEPMLRRPPPPSDENPNSFRQPAGLQSSLDPYAPPKERPMRSASNINPPPAPTPVRPVVRAAPSGQKLPADVETSDSFRFTGDAIDQGIRKPESVRDYVKRKEQEARMRAEQRRRGYSHGGSVRGDGAVTRGRTRGTVR